MTHQLSIPIAFVAGVVSFLSPCVLPLVPGYISMLSGASVEEMKSGPGTELMGRIFRSSLAFAAGFSVGCFRRRAVAAGGRDVFRVRTALVNAVGGGVV